MKVRVVAVTKPIIEEAKTAEEFIAYAAKVSNPAKQDELDTAPKLLSYLIKHDHWSPFEMASVVMEIETTRDIARQILRHRSFSFQEFSQRYAKPSEMGEMFLFKEVRMQDTKNRQNSIITDDEDLKKEWERDYKWLTGMVTQGYQKWIDKGVAKEVVRSLLPEGFTKSRLYMSGSVRSWYHYCKLRMANGTQQEHMDIAKECWAKLEEHFPTITKLEV